MSSSATISKRERFRRFLIKGGNAPESTKTSTLNLAQQPGPSSTNDQFLSDALDLLPESEQTIIRQHATDHIGTTIQAAHDAAQKQKSVCEEKRWVGSEKADKVLGWLDRFKSVGDIVANTDPIHVGLPWAGIRLLLEAAVADSRQMNALVTGFDLALYIANRLRAYFTYYQHLPTAQTTDNFKKALVLLYAHVLGFFAKAIRVYSMSILARKAQAFWQESEIITFEKECDILGARANIEADNCDRELRTNNASAAVKWKRDLDTNLQHLHSTLQALFDDLHVRVDLSKLLIAHEATYNSSTEEKKSFCLEGTRSEILDHVQQWADGPDSKFIFWLCGKAGTGKSTISRTVAQRFDKPSGSLEERRLAASFFFKRGEQDRSNADLFFSTIAIQFADLIPQMRVPLSKALDGDSLLGGRGRGLQEQFEKLLLEPLLGLDTLALPQHNILIVIDALDECDRDMDIRRILKLLARIGAESALRLRILLTSRPEFPVRLGFREIDANGYEHLHHDIMLEIVQEQTISRDIRAYFETEFAKIRHERDDDPLLQNWPSQVDLGVLVDRAVPLFIFASTVCRFVSERKPYTRLKAILAARDSAMSSQLAQTYLPILNHLLLDEDSAGQNEIIRDFRRIVGPLILAADPLSVASLAGLLGIESQNISGELNDLLQYLHSVLDIPPNLDQPIRLLHLSFRDFLIDRKRDDKEGFWIDEIETHRQLARNCVRRLEERGGLQDDICHVVRPGFKRVDMSRQQIATHIAPDVAYACSYWPLHFLNSKEHLLDNSAVHHFLQQHFLHWLEALSWLGRLSSVIAYIDDLSSTTQVSSASDCLTFSEIDKYLKDIKSVKVNEFLQDAKRFVLTHRYIIDLAPLQIYHSAMIFTPTQSVIRQHFQQQVPRLWACLPNMPERWGAHILELQGHSEEVSAITFSPNAQVIASASLDKTARLWNATTGEEVHKLEGHRKELRAVVFLPDGRTLVSASVDVVLCWDVATGVIIRKLEGYSEEFTAVALSPDGQTVAWNVSGVLLIRNVTTGETIRTLEGPDGWILDFAFSRNGQTVVLTGWEIAALYDVVTGKEIQRLEGYTDRGPFKIVFSPDGQMIVFMSYGAEVQRWIVATGKQMQTLELQQPQDGHDLSICAIACSPDGQTIALGLDDGTVRLLHMMTGEELVEFEARGLPATVVTFSPNGNTIAWASQGGQTRLMNVPTGEDMQGQKMRSPKGDLNVVRKITFSPGGQTIASVSDDRSVRLWNVTTGKKLRTFEGHMNSINQITFSPNGEIVASASDDSTVGLCNVTTGKAMQRLGGHTKGVNAVAFSSDSQIIASASDDETVRSWHVVTGKEIQVFKGHSDLVSIVTFSLDGRTIASASNDGTIRLWNAATGIEVQKLESPRFRSMSIAFAPDEQTIALACANRTVRLWDVVTGEIIQIISDVLAYKIAFSRNGQSLETDLGIFPVRSFPLKRHVPCSSTNAFPPWVSLKLRREWICKDDEDLLWLPFEFRGDRSAVYGQSLAIGKNSGGVAIFTLA